MLDQNTDRMWYVIGAVLIGASIIFGMNTFMPSAFASVTGLFTNISESTESAVDKIHQNREEIPFSMDAVEPWYTNMPFERQSDTAIEFGTRHDYKGGVYIPIDYFEFGKTYTMAFDLTILDGTVEGIGGHVFFTDETSVTINGRTPELWDKGATAYPDANGEWSGHNSLNMWAAGVEYPSELNQSQYVEMTFTRDLYPDQVGLVASDERFYIQPNRTRGHTWDDNALEYTVLLENLILYEHIEEGEDE